MQDKGIWNVTTTTLITTTTTTTTLTTTERSTPTCPACSSTHRSSRQRRWHLVQEQWTLHLVRPGHQVEEVPRLRRRLHDEVYKDSAPALRETRTALIVTLLDFLLQPGSHPFDQVAPLVHVRYGAWLHHTHIDHEHGRSPAIPYVSVSLSLCLSLSLSLYYFIVVFFQ